jgi:polyprenyldihydroxybenzoate methyltransferase / 3-demethylubiquinol 3-O-methyltransferase
MASLKVSRLLALPSNVRTLYVGKALASSALRQGYPARSISTTNNRSSEAIPSQAKDSSVNHEEVSHFNALASSWWDSHGSSRLLHLMNPLRHDFIQKCTEPDGDADRKSLKYLDIGCGGGIFAESAARLANTASVTAIDPTPEVIAVARKHQRQDPLLLQPGRLEYKQSAIEDLPIPSSPEQAYDIITVFEVIEHIRKPSAFLQSCIKYLKPGGWIIGSTIARTNVSWFTTKFMAEDVLRIVPQGTHDWNQYIQPNELKQWARVQPELDATQEGEGWRVMGVVYVPGLGWKEVGGSEEWGNYFFGMRKGDV